MALFFGALAGNQIFGYTMLQMVMAICMLIGFLIIFKMTDGYEELPTKDVNVQQAKNVSKKKEKSSIGQILKNLFQNPPLLMLLIADYGRMTTSFLMSGVIVYYYTYVAESLGLMSLHILLTAIGGIMGNLITPIINKKINARMMTIIFSFISGGFYVLAKFVGTNTVLFMGAYTLAAIAAGVVFSTIVTLYSDTITYGEWKTGKNASGFIMGLMNFPLKVAKMTNGMVMAAALASIAFVAKMTPTPALKTGIINIASLAPAAGLFLCGIILLFGFRLTGDRLEQMQNEIDAR